MNAKLETSRSHHATWLAEELQVAQESSQERQILGKRCMNFWGKLLNCCKFSHYIDWTLLFQRFVLSQRRIYILWIIATIANKQKNPPSQAENVRNFTPYPLWAQYQTISDSIYRIPRVIPTIKQEPSSSTLERQLIWGWHGCWKGLQNAAGSISCAYSPPDILPSRPLLPRCLSLSGYFPLKHSPKHFILPSSPLS